MRTILNEGRLLIRQLRPRQLVLVEPRRSLDEGGQYMESTCHLFDSLNFISHVLLMFFCFGLVTIVGLISLSE